MNPHFEVILAAAIWGLTGVFIKILQLPSTTLSFFRSVVPTVVVLGYLLYRRRKILGGKHHVILFASLLNGIWMLLYFIGFTRTTVGNAVIILYTGPIITSVLSALILKEQMTSRKIFLTLLAFIGILVMFSNKQFSLESGDVVGMTAVLASTTIWSFSLLIFKKQITRYTKTETIFYQNLLPTLMFLPFLFINRPFPTFTQVEIGTIYAFLVGVVAFFLYFSALKKLEVSTVSVLSYVEVVSAIFFAVVILHETVTGNMVVGETENQRSRIGPDYLHAII